MPFTLSRLAARLASPKARIALWCVALVVAYLASFGWPGGYWPRYRIDLDVYRIGGAALLNGTPLYGPLPATEIGAELPFTYPPFAAMLFVPLAAVPMPAANLAMVAGTWVAMWVVVRLTVGLVAPGQRGWLVPLAFGLAFTLGPVVETMGFGQINIVLMALVVADALFFRDSRWRGALVGVAIAIKLTPAVFLAYYFVRRDWRGLFNALGSTLACTLIGLAVAPADSVIYWTSALRDPSRIGNLAYVSNQSINGLLARLVGEDIRGLLWFGVCAVLGLAVLKLAHDVARAGCDFAALLMFATYTLLASPVSWSHHWVWAVPILLVLGAWWHETRSPWPGGVALAGLAILIGRVLWWQPEHTYQGADWPWWQHIQGNAQVLWGLAVIFVLARRGWRAAS